MRQRSAGKFVPRRCFMAWNISRQSVAMKSTWDAPVVESPTRVFKSKHLKSWKATERGDEGAVSENGRVWGTSIHGLFDQAEFRRGWLNRVRGQEGTLAHFAS